MNKLLAFIIISLLLFMGCFHNPSAVDTSGEYYDMFAAVWEEYEANYPEFTIKGVNWKDIFYEYSDLALQAETAEELAYEVLQPMLTEIMDAHIYMLEPDGTLILTYTIDYFKNFEESGLMENYLLPAGFTGNFDEFGYCDPDLLPYISINAWDLKDELETIAGYLEACAEKPSIIIDMRNNPGGPAYYVSLLAGCFTSTVVRGGYRRRRTGPGYDDVFHEIQYIQPNPSAYYDGIVYVLIGEFSLSATEVFALYMQSLDNVVLIGDNTLGLGCAISKIEFADGWTVAHVEWSTRGLDYQPLEWYGITPDILIETTQADLDQGLDPVLEYAIELVNSHSP